MTLRRALLLYKFNGQGHDRPLHLYFWVALTVLVAIATVVSTFEDPRTLPSNLVSLIAWVGWAIGLRYWAVSLNAPQAGLNFPRELGPRASWGTHKRESRRVSGEFAPARR